MSEEYEKYEALDLSLDGLIEFMEEELEDDKLDPVGVNGYRVAYQKRIIEVLTALEANQD